MDALLLHPAELVENFCPRGSNGLVAVSGCGRFGDDGRIVNSWCRGRGGWLSWGCLVMCGRGASDGFGGCSVFGG